MKKLVLIGTLIGLVSCQPEPSAEVMKLPDEQPLDPTLYAPKVGHEWIYRQTSRQVKPNPQLPIDESSLLEQTSQRIQRYEEPLKIDGKTFHRFSITQNGEPRPDLLLGYGMNTLFVVAQAQPDGSFNTNEARIPLAHKDMTVGTFWRWPPGAAGTSGFRIVSFEEVRVPAGIFEAYKVTYQGDQAGTVSLKDYWFTPGVGIIREESRTYQGGLLRAQSVIELEKIAPPGPAPAALDP